MSRELVLVSKRRFDDLVKRASTQSLDKGSGKAIDEEKDIEQENQQSVNSNQHGYGGVNPFTEMTFESFDQLHEKSRLKKKRVKSKWLNFKL